jgi:hypothetical protein
VVVVVVVWGVGVGTASAEHNVLPVAAWNLPIGHIAQCALLERGTVLCPNRPATHLTQLGAFSLGWNWPGSHAMHLAEPCALRVPDRHAVQLLIPLLDCDCPASHCEQYLLPKYGMNFPGGQSRQYFFAFAFCCEKKFVSE